MNNAGTAPTKTVLITGAAGGLGSALVKAFAMAGWQVAAGIHKSTPDADSGSALTVSLDVTDSSSVSAAVDGTIAHFGHLDVLVNNAGLIADAPTPLLDLEAWDRCLAVNLRGVFLCTKAVLRSMCSRRSGHIINIASYSGLTGTAGQAAYSAAKAGVIALTQSTAKEYGSRNIRANAILPGAMDTRMVAGLSAERRAGYTQANALGRWSDPHEVARFICSLAEFSTASGQIFQMDSRIPPWS